MVANFTIFLEWGQDLVITPSGGIQKAFGWDMLRQMIERFLLTNFDTVEPSGIRVLPDYIFHPGYGLGLRTFVGENLSDTTLEAMRQKCTQAVLAFPGVASNPAPEVIFKQDVGHVLEIYINVFLADGTPGTIALQLSQ